MKEKNTLVTQKPEVFLRLKFFVRNYLFLKNYVKAWVGVV